MSNSNNYKSLKEGWIPLPDLAEKYELNMYRRTLIIAQLREEHKEQIGKTWVMFEEEVVKLLPVLKK